MKKRNVWIAICALLSALCIGVGCGKQNAPTDNSTSQESSTTESSGSDSSDTATDSSSDTGSDSSSDGGSDSSSDSTSDSNSNTNSDSSGDEVDDSNLAITAPTGEVYPYIENAKNYLQAGAGADVYDYYVKIDNPQVPVQVMWTYEGTADKFLVEYATNADFSNALSITVDGDKTVADLYNLYKASTYHVRVTAFDANGTAVDSQESEFETTALGPRVMNIEGIYNVRDLGGYQTSLGKTIVQGIAYRGGALTIPSTGVYDSNITEAGKKYMSEVMGIKGELDFRNAGEAGLSGGSVIPGATLTYITAGGYSDIFSGQRETYRKIFSYFADETNYPLYYHCTGGADRTGTVTFVLHALLGVSETECIQGYEFTSFSVYRLRGAQSGTYVESFQALLNGLKAYPGDNLQQKTENYLLDIGVTEDEIYNIKAIFFGEPTKAVVYAPDKFVKNVDGDLVLPFASGKTPKTLYLNGTETTFTHTKGRITVKPNNLPALTKGNVTGKVVFTDDTFVEFSFIYDEVNVANLDGYLNFDSDGKVLLTANKTPLTTNTAIGYDKTLCVYMQTTSASKTDGGTRVFLGSYGFECRGGELRPYTLDANGTMKEYARDAGMALPNTVFNDGATLHLTINFVDDKPVITVKVVTATAVYEHTYTFANRVANEIATDNAKATFWIRTDAITSLTIYNTAAWEQKNA